MSKKKPKTTKKPAARRRAAAGEPRPSLQVARQELTKVRAALRRIRSANADVNGPLNEAQRVKIDTAIRDINTTMSQLSCIQDQAPYGFRS